MIELLQGRPRGGWLAPGQLTVYIIFFVIAMIWSVYKTEKDKKKIKDEDTKK